ncbi:MAG: site-specific integrase, partial [Acidimicrobiales bacterium]
MHRRSGRGDGRRRVPGRYCGHTRTSYATDLRLFTLWCRQASLTLFAVRRAHLELFGRWMEENGRMRSTVARRLSTLASFYRYASRSSGWCATPLSTCGDPRSTTSRAPWA